MPTYDFGHGPVPAHRHRNADGSEGGWIAETAQVDNTAYIGEQAQIYGHTQVSGDAWVFGDAQVFGNARVYVHAQVSGDAKICGQGQVFGDAWVYDAHVFENAQVFGNCQVFGSARVFGRANVLHNAQVSNHVIICEDDRVSRTPLVLTGLAYPVTVSDRHIQIGCTCLTFDDARRYTIARATREHGVHAAKFVRVTKSLLMSLLRYAESH